MATEFFLPKMTDFMESAEIVSWLVPEGAVVKEHQPILEVMTDKVAAEVEAPASGVLKGIRAGAVPGATAPVGETLAWIAQPGEDVPVLPPLGAAGGPAAPTAPAARAPEAGGARAADIRATPVVRRMAREMGVDLALLKGSGPGGRVTEEDLHHFSSGGASAPLSPSSPDDDEVTWQDLSPLQRATGQRMVQSMQAAPQFSLTVDVDMSAALAWREQVKGAAQTSAAGVSVTALLVKAVALALHEHPLVNSAFVDGRRKAYRRVNIGVAVGSESGILVPVVREAAHRPLLEIAAELEQLREKALAGRLQAEDMAGGTFTISNLGMYGVDAFRAIINPGQSAILAVGRIRRAPAVAPDGVVCVRPFMTLVLSVDHRSLDGLQAARFLSAIKDALEQAAFT